MAYQQPDEVGQVLVQRQLEKSGDVALLPVLQTRILRKQVQNLQGEDGFSDDEYLFDGGQ